jgi:hypothetical protein
MTPPGGDLPFYAIAKGGQFLNIDTLGGLCRCPFGTLIWTRGDSRPTRLGTGRQDVYATADGVVSPASVCVCGRAKCATAAGRDDTTALREIDSGWSSPEINLSP